jgi:hypothetical protein
MAHAAAGTAATLVSRVSRVVTQWQDIRAHPP